MTLSPDEQEFWTELQDMSRRELAIMACLSLRRLIDLDASHTLKLEHEGVNCTVMAAKGSPARSAFQFIQQELVNRGGDATIKERKV